MLIFALFLSLTALLLLVFALRGRIVDRGVFCRKCRFNFVGIDPNAPDARCPECGRAIARGKPPARVLRVRSKVLGGTAGLLLMIAVVLAGISISGNAPAVYKHMPDRVVVHAATWGSDPALDELLTRSGLTPPMSDRLLQTAIEHGLGLQADESVAWDTRWGELLFNAAISERMSNDQFARYIMSLDEFTFELRDRVRAGTPQATVLIEASSDRGNARTGGELPLQRTLRLTRAGVEGDEKQLAPRGKGIALPFPVRVQRDQMRMFISMDRQIDLAQDGRLPQAGETVTVVFEYTLALTRDGEDKPFHEHHGRIEREIEVVPEDAELVARSEPAGSAADAAQKFGIPDIGVTDPLPPVSELGRYQILMVFNLRQERRSLPIAYRILFRSDEGEEFDLHTTVQGPLAQPRQLGYMVGTSNLDERKRSRLLRAAGIMLEQGHATLIFRADPSLATDEPTIDEILDLDLIFERLPVVPSPPGQFNNSSIVYGKSGDNTIGARPLPGGDEPEIDTPESSSP